MNWIDICRYEIKCSMCLWAILLSCCAGYPFIPLFAENDLCFKLDILVSEEGALHNRQIWPEAPRAAKLSVLSPQITLMWNNFIFCLWCFPLFSLCCTHPFLSFILSCIDLKLYLFVYLFNCIIFSSTFCYNGNAYCFSFAAFCFVFGCVHLTCIFLFYILCFFSLQPRSLLDPKVLGLQSGGWVVAHFLIWFTITQIWTAVLFCTLMLRHM